MTATVVVVGVEDVAPKVVVEKKGIPPAGVCGAEELEEKEEKGVPYCCGISGVILEWRP